MAQRVGAGQLESLLRALWDEYEEAQISRYKRVVFLLLKIAVYSIPISIVSSFVLISVFGKPETAQVTPGDYPGLVAFLLAPLAIASLVVLIPMNLPLIRTVRRRIRLSRKLRLVTAAEPAGGSPARSVTFWILMCLVVVPLVVVIVEAEQKGQAAWFIAVLFLLLIALPVFLFRVNRSLARANAQLTLLEDADRLRASLAKRQEEARRSDRGFVELTHQEADRLAAIEQDLTESARVRAISSALSDRDASYTIFKEPSLREQMEDEPPANRLLLENHIQDLAQDPLPAGVRSSGGDQWTLPVPGTSIEVKYRLDEQSRHILILALDKSGSAPSGGAR